MIRESYLVIDPVSPCPPAGGSRSAAEQGTTTTTRKPAIALARGERDSRRENLGSPRWGWYLSSGRMADADRGGEEEGERERDGDYINEMAMRAGVSNLSK